MKPKKYFVFSSFRWEKKRMLVKTSLRFPKCKEKVNSIVKSFSFNILTIKKRFTRIHRFLFLLKIIPKFKLSSTYFIMISFSPNYAPNKRQNPSISPRLLFFLFSLDNKPRYEIWVIFLRSPSTSNSYDWQLTMILKMFILFVFYLPF